MENAVSESRRQDAFDRWEFACEVALEAEKRAYVAVATLAQAREDARLAYAAFEATKT